MLTRSDCWEPLERHSFQYLEARCRVARPQTGNAYRDPPLAPAPVDRVIRAMRQTAYD